MSREYLLDTHVLIWAAIDDARLGEPARTRLLSDAGIVISTVSIWEMAIKKSLGKLEMDIPLQTFIQGQVEALAARVLPVTASHALAVEHFPFHHRDPFDRLLAAQTLTEGMEFISADPIFDSYPISRVW